MIQTTALLLLSAASIAAAASRMPSVEEYHQAMANPIVGEGASSGVLIVGGTPTRPDQYLFTVGLRSSQNGPNFCGGSLIDATHVLTAAHCISRYSASPTWVSLGSHFLSGSFDGQQVRVTNRTVHPDYQKPKSMSNDFAILELAEPALPSIPTIVLASASNTDETPIGRTAITCGWGTTTQGGSQSDVKLETTVPILSNEQCHETLTGVDGTMICAGYDQGGKDTCQGDSGGPFFTQRHDGQPILVGVVSWGIGCAREKLPGVYSRVSTALDFIRQHAPNARSFAVV